tara:strand:+ start:940 stop:1248 length:309 start_codon:yes stop_codon:yes gene_type:complete
MKMLISELKELRNNDLVKNVRFIESGCSPMVVEVEYGRESLQKELIKTEKNSVLSFKNIRQAYDLCREAGINQAELVQVIPHDEACFGQYMSYDQQTMPLRF